jgi:hypothetical protein
MSAKMLNRIDSTGLSQSTNQSVKNDETEIGEATKGQQVNQSIRWLRSRESQLVNNLYQLWDRHQKDRMSIHQ